MSLVAQRLSIVMTKFVINLTLVLINIFFLGIYALKKAIGVTLPPNANIL